MSLLCRYPDVCADEDLTALDDTEIADAKKDDTEWLEQLAKQQQTKFMNMIEKIAHDKPEEDERPFADSASEKK